VEKQSMVKQPPAPLKSAVQSSTTTLSSSKQQHSSNISSSISTSNKTVNLSSSSSTLKATSSKKKYGGVSPSSRSRSATKELILPPDDSSLKKPEFTVSLKHLTIGDGERLTLQCSVAGDPEPQVTWFKDGRRLESNDFVDLKYKYGLATLKIEEVYPEDAGEYKCVAKNIAGTAECQCTLKVLRKFT
jgi:hypothetical protein